MSGTVEGGKKAAAKNKYLYGKNFYVVIGTAGGKKSTGGGFAKMDKELVREAGRRGGSASRRKDGNYGRGFIDPL